MHRKVLKSPLFVDWSEQYVRLPMSGVTPGTPLLLQVDGAPVRCQWDGDAMLVKLAFAKDEIKEFIWTENGFGSNSPLPRSIPLHDGIAIGQPGCELLVGTHSPFHEFAGRPMQSEIRCDTRLERSSLTRLRSGPLFTDYELEYHFASRRHYALTFRCYTLDPWIEVSERFSLGLNGELSWILNPERQFTHILSRDSFEGESQPTVEPLGVERPRDILCRLQMPVLSEYFIPNNRGWFAFFDQRNEAGGMVGILGLHGAKWQEPVANMPVLYDREGQVEWRSSLVSGSRHWLLVASPVNTEWRADERLLFHRLHAEFNALRLDEHLDLTGETSFDEACASRPAIFVGDDYRRQALARCAALPALKAFQPDDWLKANGTLHVAIYAALLSPTAENHQAIYDALVWRFEKWVRQFQGWREGKSDYMKNVIGFSRYLRGMLIGYELLRKDKALTDEQVRRLGAWFAFAARRILDEGRWPHSRTWKHPDHPDSTRDFYTYGGEHKPDRLIWTNSLPNFQSDPLCALAHLSGIFQDHPDAIRWREFALAEIERQLDAYAGKSGAWEESINYALYTLSYLVITFRVVKQRWGIDYFQDERMRRFVGWLCRFFGPYDQRFGSHTWPAIGNAVLPQNQGHYLLAYAAELPPDDPLRHDCMAIYQLTEDHQQLSEHYPTILAAMAPIPDRRYALTPLASEQMDEVGVSMRHHHLAPDESYLFQKIGFAKDHYEADETAFNWYAKGVPLCMDYGTYTGDIAVAGAHNLVEIPDEDNLRRGYLADRLFTSVIDYTHCEVPVTLKLLWGRVRGFEDVENKDGKIDRTKTPYFYIGDPNPVGPKCWKVRKLLYVKPDYMLLFDRVHGHVPHRFNLHVTGDHLVHDGRTITARGRFGLDLLAYVQHPAEFLLEKGEIIPAVRGASGDNGAGRLHAQHYFRLYNQTDGIYRTLLFAREPGRQVQISSPCEHVIKVETEAFTDYLVLHEDEVIVDLPELSFRGRAGWIRREANGVIRACVPSGCELAAFGTRFDGRGPWHYNLADGNGLVVCASPPRQVTVETGA